MRRRKLLTILLVSCGTIASCVTVPSTKVCAVAGKMAGGAVCAETETNVQTQLDLDELIDLLEPQEARTCVPVPGMSVCASRQVGTPVALPKRGAALIISADDFAKIKTALEQACRELGNSCSYQIPKIPRFSLP
jgi:hypothetical protein